MNNDFTDAEKKQFHEAMESLEKWKQEVSDHNHKVLKENNIPTKDYLSLTEDIIVTNKIEVVSEPGGTDNAEDHGIFKAVFVDQRSVGETGDSWAGYIYGHFGINKWLKIPYEC